MTSENDELAWQKANIPRSGGYHDLGQLHDMLFTGLPDYRGKRGFNARKLAKDMQVSYQAIYKWFERETIPANRVQRVIELSESSQHRPDDFVPLARDKFWKFLA